MIEREKLPGIDLGTSMQFIGRKRCVRYIKYILRLEREHDRQFKPKDVLDAARPKDSPIHDYFDWNDKTAGEKWRLEQARQLVKMVRVYAVDYEGKEFSRKRYTSVYVHEGERLVRAYVQTERALNKNEFRRQLLDRWISELESLTERARSFKEFAYVRKELVRIAALLRDKLDLPKDNGKLVAVGEEA